MRNLSDIIGELRAVHRSLSSSYTELSIMSECGMIQTFEVCAMQLGRPTRRLLGVVQAMDACECVSASTRARLINLARYLIIARSHAAELYRQELERLVLRTLHKVCCELLCEIDKLECLECKNGR